MPQSTAFSGWRVVFGCFVIMSMPFAIVFLAHSIFLHPVTEALGFSATQFSLMFTIVAVTTALTSPFVGKLMQKFDIRYLMAISGATVSLAFGLLGTARSLWQFYLLAAVIGISATGITQVPVSNIITNWFPTKKKGLATGLAFAGGNVGSFLTILLVTNLLPKIGYAKCYLLLGGIMFVVTVLCSLFVIRGSPASLGQRPFGSLEEEGCTTRTATPLTGLTLTQAKSSAVFWVFIVAIVLLGVVFSGVQVHVPSYLISIGHSMPFSSTVTSVVAITGIVSNVLIGALLEKAGLKLGLVIVGSFMVIALVLLVLSGYAPFAFCFAVLFGMFASIAAMGPSYLTSEMFGKRDYGTILGLVMMFFQLGGAVGPTLSGYLYDATGQYHITWIIYIVLLIITFGTFLLSIRLSERKRALV